MSSRPLPVPLSMTPSCASGTSTPSSSTRDVAITGYRPVRKPPSTSRRSSFGVRCVIDGTRNRVDTARTMRLLCVNTMVRTPACSSSMERSSSSFAALFIAISAALFRASRASRAALFRLDIIMRRRSVCADGVVRPSRRIPDRKRPCASSYAACSPPASLTLRRSTSYGARWPCPDSAAGPTRNTTPPTRRGTSSCRPSSLSSVAVSPRRRGAIRHSAIVLYPRAGRWCTSSNTTSPNRDPTDWALAYAESYVATVSADRLPLPPPSRPISGAAPRGEPARRCLARTPAHWSIRSIVGTTTSAGAPASCMARTATAVLPAPVGITTQPLIEAAFQLESARCWYARSFRPRSESGSAGM